ncbi:MAG: hypothetical protein QHC79_09590 [Pseudosphingobacterium sp.]|nr:hypothetical protein [Pseudosphingobacterium sp.]
MSKLSYTVSKAIEGKFEIINTHLPSIIHPKLGAIDFRTITEEQAQKLVDAGSMYIQKVEKAEKKPSKSESAG